THSPPPSSRSFLASCVEQYDLRPFPTRRSSDLFGGMENTTATTMYEHLLIDKKASLDIDAYDLVAHELAHQWFGDLVTCRDWSHAWLNEGFATYFEHVEQIGRAHV